MPGFFETLFPGSIGRSLTTPSVLPAGGMSPADMISKYVKAPSSTDVPPLAETPEQKRRRELLQKAMAGQGSFENIFGTGPGAIKSVTTKPDGSKTVSYNTPPIEALPATEAIKMAQSGVPASGQFDLGVRSTANEPGLVQQPSSGVTPLTSSAPDRSLGAILGNPGVFGALGQLGAAIGGPGSFAERLGGFATNQARNRLFDQYLQQRLAGTGGAGQQAPFGLNALGIGLLSPQEQLAATNQPLTELGALSDAAYKQALISGVETPEQLLNRQALITLLGKEPGRPNAGSFQNLEVGLDGKRTPGITHKWLIDDITGEPIRYEGVVGATDPSGGMSDQQSTWYQKAVNEAKLNVDREASQYGKIQTDAFGNVTGIEWSDADAPRRYQESYYKHLLKAIKRFQALGNLPPGFSVPFEQEASGFQQQSKPKSSLLK